MIQFECLGFSTNPVFFVIDDGVFPIGTIRTMIDDVEFFVNDFYKGKLQKDLPSPDEVISEYKRQFAEKGVWENKKSFRAG